MTATLPYFDAAQVHAALDYPALIDALRLMFAAKSSVPLRHVHALDADASARLLLMPAWQADAAIAVKVVTVFPGNRALGAATVGATVLLLDGATGHPRAVLDGEALTLRRTAAASALASSHLSRDDAQRLLLVGAGHLAPYMAHAHCAVRPIRQVRVWARNPQAAAALAARLSSEGLPATAARNLDEETAAADVISCATTSSVPLVRGAAVRPGTHVDLVGAFTPQMRESDDALIRGASVFVDTFAGALSEAGDLTQPIAAGVVTRDHVRAELADLVCGRHPGRRGTDEITVFKSVGTALEDLAAAMLVLRANGDGASGPTVAPARPTPA